MSKIKFYIEKMQALGYAANNVLVGSGINAAELDDFHYQVTPEQYQLIVSNMLSLSGRMDLGIDFGLSLHPPDYGILGYAMATSDNLNALYNLWERYNHSLYGAALKTGRHQIGNRTCVTAEVMLPPGSAYRFCMEELLFSSRNFIQLLLDSNASFSQVELSYERPPYAERLETTIHCPVTYNADRNIMFFDGKLFDHPIKSNNLELHRLYSELCQKLAGELPGQPVSQRIRALFLQRPDRIPTMPEMASLLHTSARTLRRQLLDEGRSYRELVNEFRCNYAKEYLRTTKLSTREIAYALGYQDDKALIKAFKNQTGITPGQFRANGR